jgi:pyruvate dehydrogenase E1 component
MEEPVDGDWQKLLRRVGAYIREHFFGTDPSLRQAGRAPERRRDPKPTRGGHDPEKVYAAYKAAVHPHEGRRR